MTDTVHCVYISPDCVHTYLSHEKSDYIWCIVLSVKEKFISTVHCDTWLGNNLVKMTSKVISMFIIIVIIA